MITGFVDANRDPVLLLSVLDASGQSTPIRAVVDTGFNGWLSLPPSLVSAWSLPWKGEGRAFLADGSEILFNTYEANILWDGAIITIPVDEADADPLIGMSLLYGHEVLIQAIDGGTVSIKRL